MNAKLLALPLVLLTYGALAQGFAGLGTDAQGFSVPEAGRELSFPRDHGPHPDFRIEWWYLTANLKDENGADYGLQWTLFRSALRPEAGEGWSASQTWMAHAAVTADNSHFSTERFARGGIGQAGVRAEPFSAWIDDWRMTSRAAPGEDPLAALEVFARGPDFILRHRVDRVGSDGSARRKRLLGQIGVRSGEPLLFAALLLGRGHDRPADRPDFRSAARPGSTASGHRSRSIRTRPAGTGFPCISMTARS